MNEQLRDYYEEDFDTKESTLGKMMDWGREQFDGDTREYLDKGLAYIGAIEEAELVRENMSYDWEEVDDVLSLTEDTGDYGLLQLYMEDTSGFEGDSKKEAGRKINDLLHKRIQINYQRGPGRWEDMDRAQRLYRSANRIDGVDTINYNQAYESLAKGNISGTPPAYIAGLPEEKQQKIFDQFYKDKNEIGWLKTFPSSDLASQEAVEAYGESIANDLKRRGMNAYEDLPFDLCDDIGGFLSNPHLKPKMKIKIAQAFYRELSMYEPKHIELADKIDSAMMSGNYGPGLMKVLNKQRAFMMNPENYDDPNEKPDSSEILASI